MSVKCPNCNFENLDDSRFCSKCAAPLLSSEEISVSPTETLQTSITGLPRWSTFAQRYEVIEELDKGGMGKIYRVLDKKIDQEVALKLLRPEIASDQETIVRFKNELKLARKISHRNVCRMYDLGEEGNAYYITMEYVSGENLKSLIRRTDKLTIGKAIAISKQVCDGLTEAHRLGVIHRDLKPGNIMIDNEGNARILDFGIARSLRTKGMTGAGILIGTPEYMSPEQVDGKDVDHSSDLYSLGIILYEMVTGKVPFKGDTPISIAVKHKTEKPASPREINPQISEDFNTVILKCLDKDKNKRYQSADELFADLSKIERDITTIKTIISKKKQKAEKPADIRWIRSLLIGAAIAIFLTIILSGIGSFFENKLYGEYESWIGIDSIAVLPLKNHTGNSRMDYFADRLTEGLIDEMTKTGLMQHVTPTTSIMQYKAAPKRIADIARELKVDAVVEGSILLDKEQMQVSVKLLDAKKEQPLWDNSYKRDMRDELDAQIELVKFITQEIITSISDKEISFLYRAYLPYKISAIELCKKGRYLWHRDLFGGGRLMSDWHFEFANQADPNCALAYSGLADNRMLYGRYSQGKKLAMKALEIDNNLAEAWTSIARARMGADGDWEGAQLAFKRAIFLDPDYMTARLWYGQLLAYLARFEEAIKQINQALQLDPFSLTVNIELARILYYAGKHDQAVDVLEKTIKIYPDSYSAHYYLGLAYVGKSEFRKALEVFQRLEQKYDRPIQSVKDWIGIIQIETGKRDEAREILDGISKGFWNAPELTALYFALGEDDEGFKWLDEVYKRRYELIFTLKINPLFDSVREDSRFKEMLKKVGLEQ